MSVDPKKLFEKYATKKERDRRPTNLYLDKLLYKRFKKLCKDNGAKSAGKIIEDLMRDFIERAEPTKKEPK